MEDHSKVNESENQTSKLILHELNETKSDQKFHIPGLFLLQHSQKDNKKTNYEEFQRYSELETSIHLESVIFSEEKKVSVIGNLVKTSFEEKNQNEINFDLIDKALENQKATIEYDSENLTSSDTENSLLTLRKKEKNNYSTLSYAYSTEESSKEDEYDIIENTQNQQKINWNHNKNNKILSNNEKSHSENWIPKTKNEILYENVEIKKLDVIITDDMPIEYLGEISQIVDNTVVIKAFVFDDYKVLDEESLLVLEDRSILGLIFETFGRVSQPMYSVRFDTLEKIDEKRISIGKKVYLVPKYSKYVFTKELRINKGSDASNIHDEEIDESEQEFSDDQAEMEYKSRIKNIKPHIYKTTNYNFMKHIDSKNNEISNLNPLPHFKNSSSNYAFPSDQT